MSFYQSSVRYDERYHRYYRENLSYVETLLSEQDKLSSIRKSRKKKHKLSALERVEELIDPQTEFFEFSMLAGIKDPEVPLGGGIITGLGQVSGRVCVVIANDYMMKGGTYYPITIKKHLRAQEIALQNHLPCLYIVDSGGVFLPKQAEVFPDRQDFGKVFCNQAQMSAAGIPQIASVHGLCVAGGAYIPAMSDQTIIVEKQGCIFLAGPALVESAIGEIISAENLGGAKVHCEKAGTADYMAANDHEALKIMRQLVDCLPNTQSFHQNLIRNSSPPRYKSEEILGVVPANLRQSFDIRELIIRIVDNSEFMEFKPSYGKSLCCGYANIMGIPVGILANNGILFSESALKAVHFIQICCQQKIPLFFLQNITGFMVGRQYEEGGIAKNGAKMIQAVSNAQVPKITLIFGNSFGAGNYGMCGRSFSPHFLFSWPNSKTAVMGGKQAADVLVQIKRKQQQQGGKSKNFDEIILRRSIEEQFTRESSAYYGTSKLWDDGIIDPRQTRKTIGKALVASCHYEWPETRFGVFRM